MADNIAPSVTSNMYNNVPIISRQKPTSIQALMVSILIAQDYYYHPAL